MPAKVDAMVNVVAVENDNAAILRNCWQRIGRQSGREWRELIILARTGYIDFRYHGPDASR